MKTLLALCRCVPSLILCGTFSSGHVLAQTFSAQLVANTPKKGDAADWKTKTEALLTAAKGTDGAALLKAANCKACHDAHK